MAEKEEKLIVEQSIVDKEQVAVTKAEKAISKADPKNSGDPS